MAIKKRPVVLAKLAEVSRGELNAMSSALSDAKSDVKGVDAKPAHWGRRFVASGKVF